MSENIDQLQAERAKNSDLRYAISGLVGILNEAVDRDKQDRKNYPASGQTRYWLGGRIQANEIIHDALQAILEVTR